MSLKAELLLFMEKKMNKEIMKEAGFSKYVEKVELGICPFCNKPVNTKSFRDALSKKEYEISGLCQQCQDNFFGK